MSGEIIDLGPLIPRRDNTSYNIGAVCFDLGYRHRPFIWDGNDEGEAVEWRELAEFAAWLVERISMEAVDPGVNAREAGNGPVAEPLILRAVMEHYVTWPAKTR